MYKLEISRDYSIYKIIDILNNNYNENKSIDPLKLKLLYGDIIDVNNNIIKSPLKNMIIPAVVILNKSYRHTNNKIIYKCIPYNKNYPLFLVSKPKNKSFSKHIENDLVLIKYKNWCDKHPQATIVDTLGKVSNIHSYIRYLLFAKNIYYKPSIIDNTSIINTIISKNVLNIKDLTNRNVYTIDPKGSEDLDDAVGIILKDNNYIISTYISNVALVLDKLHFWSKMTNQVSTIYLENKIYPMLSKILSENMCSLKEKTNRLVICTDIAINSNNIISKVDIYPALIYIGNNYEYDAVDLLDDNDYKLLFTKIQQISQINKPVYVINNSHDLIEYLMILTNYYTAKKLYNYKTGIFRVVSMSANNTTNKLSKFLQYWKYCKSNYIEYSSNIKLNHDSLQLDLYTHITSPIRRLVDILNQIVFINNYLDISEEALEFYTKWVNNLSEITSSMKKIRKVSNYSILLNKLKIENKVNYTGYVIEILENKYTVYISELNLIDTVKTEHLLELYSIVKLKLLILWTDYKQKIRLVLDV